MGFIQCGSENWLLNDILILTLRGILGSPWHLKRTPKVFRPTAQGWRVSAYLGKPNPKPTTPTGLRPEDAVPRHNPVGVDEFWPTTPWVAFGNPGLEDGTPLAFRPCSCQRPQAASRTQQSESRSYTPARPTQSDRFA